MKNRMRSIIGLLVMAFILIPLAAQAAPVGKFTVVEGNVDITKPGAKAVPAKSGDAVEVGDVIRTKVKSKCELTMTDGNVIRLAEITRLRITEYMVGTGQQRAAMNLFRGKVQSIVKAIGVVRGSSYEVQTPTAVVGVRGTNFFTYHQAGVTGATFKEGTGYGYSLNRPQEVVTINPGQAMVVVDPNRPPAVRPATPQELDAHTKDTAPSEKPKEEGKKEEPRGGEQSRAEAAPAPAAAAGPTPSPAPAQVTAPESVPAPTPAPTFTFMPTAAPEPALPQVTPQLLPTPPSPPPQPTVPFVTMTPTAPEMSPTPPPAPEPTPPLPPEPTPPQPEPQPPQPEPTPPTPEPTPTPTPTPEPTPPTPEPTPTPTPTPEPTPPTPEPTPTPPPYVPPTTQDRTPPVWKSLTFNNRVVTGGHSLTVSNPVATDASTPITYTYAIDGGTPSSSTEFTGLSEGNHILTAYATDAADNTSSIPHKWFIGDRQYLLVGQAVGGGLQGSVSSTSEGIRVISSLPEGASKGAWLIEMGMTGISIQSPTFSMIAGGKAFIPNNPVMFAGYWLSSVEGAQVDLTHGYITGGTSHLTFLSLNGLGGGTGRFSGSYDSSSSTWQVMDLGMDFNSGLDVYAYTETPLTFASSVGVLANRGFMNSNFGLSGPPSDGHTVTQLTGLLGGTGDIWSAQQDFSMMGKYGEYYQRPIWYIDMVSAGLPVSISNIANQDIFVGGSSFAGVGYYGGIVGTKIGDALEGSGLAIYIKNGETGYFSLSDISGSFYPGIEMWEATGKMKAVPMGTTSFAPTDLDGSDSLNHGTFSGSVTGTGDITITTVSADTWNLMDQNWGIMLGRMGGTYSSSPSSDIWNAMFEFQDPQGDPQGDPKRIIGMGMEGTKWSDGLVKANVIGYGADLNLTTPATWVSVGNVQGTFDPTEDVKTFQLLSMGVSIETKTFLNLATTDAGKEKLRQLGIPAIEVGVANLTGSASHTGNQIEVNMNNVKFFSGAPMEKPKIWATESISGNFSGNPTSISVDLKMNGTTVANFTPKAWNTENGKWMGTVNGNTAFQLGPPSIIPANLYTGSVNGIKGAAAGTFTGTSSGTFSGTAAGIAK